jgi:hypothetical protein
MHSFECGRATFTFLDDMQNVLWTVHYDVGEFGLYTFTLSSDASGRAFAAALSVDQAPAGGATYAPLWQALIVLGTAAIAWPVACHYYRQYKQSQR